MIFSKGLLIYEMLGGVHPFKRKNKTHAEKLKMIIDHQIEMLPMFSDAACDLLTRLLERNVSLSLTL